MNKNDFELSFILEVEPRIVATGVGYVEDEDKGSFLVVPPICAFGKDCYCTINCYRNWKVEIHSECVRCYSRRGLRHLLEHHSKGW